MVVEIGGDSRINRLKEAHNRLSLKKCFENIANFGEFEKLWKNIYLKFLMTYGDKDAIEALKKIIEESNKAKCEEVNQKVLSSLVKIAKDTPSNDVLKNCMEFAKADLDSKKRSDYDLEKNSNLGAMDVVSAVYENPYFKSPYSNPNVEVPDFGEYSFLVREKWADISLKRGNSDIEKDISYFRKTVGTEVVSYSLEDRNKTYNKLKLCQINCSNVGVLRDRLNSVPYDILGDKKTIEADKKTDKRESIPSMMQELVEQTNGIKNSEANNIVLKYVENAVKSTQYPGVLETCAKIIARDLESKKDLGYDMNQPENLKAMDILFQGIKSKKNDIYSLQTGYSTVYQMMELSPLAEEKGKAFVEKYPEAQNKILKSQNPYPKHGNVISI